MVVKKQLNVADAQLQVGDFICITLMGQNSFVASKNKIV